MTNCCVNRSDKAAQQQQQQQQQQQWKLLFYCQFLELTYRLAATTTGSWVSFIIIPALILVLVSFTLCSLPAANRCRYCACLIIEADSVYLLKKKYRFILGFTKTETWKKTGAQIRFFCSSNSKTSVCFITSSRSLVRSFACYCFC